MILLVESPPKSNKEISSITSRDAWHRRDRRRRRKKENQSGDGGISSFFIRQSSSHGSPARNPTRAVTYYVVGRESEKKTRERCQTRVFKSFYSPAYLDFRSKLRSHGPLKLRISDSYLIDHGGGKKKKKNCKLAVR